MQALHKQYADIARSHMDEFVAKKGPERLTLVDTVVAEITAHSEKEGLPLPPSLQHVCAVLSLPFLLTTSTLQKVENWFHNHRPHTAKKHKVSKDDKNALVNWNLRKVVQQTKRDQIKQRMAIKAPGVTQAEKTWISTYHDACTEVIAGLTEAETMECERIAEEWKATGPDPLTQAM